MLNNHTLRLKITSLSLTAAILTGCASSPQSLREDTDARRIFFADVGYQIALKRVVEHHHLCDGGPLLPLGQVINDVSHYPDLRSASIVRGALGFGRQIHLVIDISEETPNRAKITLWSKAWTDRNALYYQRVFNGHLGCDA